MTEHNRPRSKNEALDGIMELLYADPHGWKMDSHYAEHRNARIVIWIASGFAYLRIESPRMRLGFFEKMKLTKALNHAVGQQALKAAKDLSA